MTTKSKSWNVLETVLSHLKLSNSSVTLSQSCLKLEVSCLTLIGHLKQKPSEDVKKLSKTNQKLS